MQHQNIRQLIKLKPVYKIIKTSQKLVLPGFEGLSLYIVSKFFFHGLRNGTLNMRASSLAFNFFLALFPSIIFVFTLIPYIPIDHFQKSLFDLLQNIMPKSVFIATEDTITDIINNQHRGLLSLGFVSALYFSTNGFNAMINAFNETYHEIETRNFFMKRLVSLFMVVFTVFMLTAAIALIILFEIGFQNLFHTHKMAYHLIMFGKWLVLFGICFCLISFNYYIGPKQKKRWYFFSAGSMFSTVLIIIASFAFGYYVNHFGKYNKLYGSIGTLIVVMMLIYINSFILLLGFDLNASIQTAKKNKGKLMKLINDI
jgi:membrane protein